MSKTMPSLLALLGLVAVAGYQNRTKISQMIDDAKQSPSGSAANSRGNWLSNIGDMFHEGKVGTTLSGGLDQLVSKFRTVGMGDKADSWVSPGTSQAVDHTDLEAALGDDTLEELAQKTGLSRVELIQRLSTALPDVIDRMTPAGRLPTASEAQALA